MPSPLKFSAILLLSIAGIEGFAYWWMHPAATGLGQPVLVYHPQEAGDRQTGDGGQEPPSSPQAPSFSDHRSLVTDHSSSTTPLPDVVEKSLPILRCSTGTAARIERDDGATIHVAFFEWDLTDSTNVLEAFKHLPEECMGSIGMTLTDHRSPRSYQVGTETLWFDHTVFRDPAGVTVHAFKGTWVAGAGNLIGKDFRGGADQWREIRWKSALHRFHPAHARVAQGAVRGIPNPDLAWEAFEKTMLVDLKMEETMRDEVGDLKPEGKRNER